MRRDSHLGSSTAGPESYFGSLVGANSGGDPRQPVDPQARLSRGSEQQWHPIDLDRQQARMSSHVQHEG